MISVSDFHETYYIVFYMSPFSRLLLPFQSVVVCFTVHMGDLCSYVRALEAGVGERMKDYSPTENDQKMKKIFLATSNSELKVCINHRGSICNTHTCLSPTLNLLIENL